MACFGGSGASTTVVSFNLHDSSNRRERRRRRSEARAAAFRARRRFGVAIQDARAAGEEYARELVAFAGLSVEAPPFSPEPRTVAAQEAGSVLFRGLYPFLDMRLESVYVCVSVCYFFRELFIRLEQIIGLRK